MERWMDIQTLGQLLRWMGSLLLLGASASFMMEGWEAFDSQLRYFLFLSYVLGLAGLGILLGWRIQEDKGARTLLGLAVAGIAVQFSQLGAMTHSLVSGEDGSLPDAFRYDISSWGTLALNAAALLLLVPVAYLGFSALNRPSARHLSLAYLLACSSLLIPVRHGSPLAALLIALAIVTWWFDVRFLAGTTAGSTAEGSMSRVLLLLPAAIAVARTAFYPQSVTFAGLMWIVSGWLAFELVPTFVKTDLGQKRWQAIATIPVIIGWSLIAFQVLPQYFDVALPVLAYLPLSLGLMLLSLRAMGGGLHYRQAAAAVAALAWFLHLTMHASVLSSFLSLAFFIGMIVVGFYYQERGVCSVGVGGALFALAYHLHFAIRLYTYSPWGLLAGAGILILMTASYMEKHAASVFGRLILLREEIKGWHS